MAISMPSVRIAFSFSMLAAMSSMITLSVISRSIAGGAPPSPSASLTTSRKPAWRSWLGEPLGQLLRVEEVFAAALLRLLEGRFGVLEQRVGIGAVVRKERDARADRQAQLRVAQAEGLAFDPGEALVDRARDALGRAHS